MGFITDEARQAERERRQMMAPDPMAVAIEELERELAECRDALTAQRQMSDQIQRQLDAEWEECNQLRERLAAAEAREQVALDILTATTELPVGRHPLAIDDAIGSLERADHAALDAALEQARRNGYYEGRKPGGQRMIAQVTAPGDPDVGIMPVYATVEFEEAEIIFEDVPEAREQFRERLRVAFAELYDDGSVLIRFEDEYGEQELTDGAD